MSGYKYDIAVIKPGTGSGLCVVMTEITLIFHHIEPGALDLAQGLWIVSS